MKWSLPSARHWWGRRSIVPLAAGLFSGGATLLQLPDHASRLAIPALAVAVWGWWLSASEAQAADQREEELRGEIKSLQTDITFVRGELDNEIRDAQAAPDLVRQLRRATGPELRAEIERVASLIIGWERDYRGSMHKPIVRPVGISDEVRTAMWQAETAASLADRDRRHADLHRDLLPQIVALESELNGRLSETRPDIIKDHRVLALTGMLAGPSPLSDVADYLRELGRKLG